MELNKKLERQAKRFDACAEGRKSLLSITDKRDMVKLYLHHIDFCLMNDYPSNEFIREQFVGVMEEFGVYLDSKVDATNERKLVLLGACDVKSEHNEYSVGEMFVKHSSQANIIVRDHAFVMVDAFDDANIHVYAYDRARVCINVYGNAHVEIMEQEDGAHVKVVNKNKKTY